MSTTTQDGVKSARTPQEAMLWVAAGIDAILAKLAEQPAPADGWGDWSKVEAASPFTYPELEDKFAEGAALVDAAIAANRAENIEVTDSDVTVEFPPADEERKADRVRWAEIGLHQFIGTGRDEGHLKLDEATALHAYVVGGPLWLYAYDRNAVMQLPMGHRQAMVDDIAKDSPTRAQEVARDILMYRSSDHSVLDVHYDANLRRD